MPARVLAAAALLSLACAPRAPAPGYGVTYGYIKPRPLCTIGERVEAVRVPAAFGHQELHVEFTVLADGRVDGFEITPGLPAEVAQRVRGAVESCGWVPGRNPAGVPAAVHVILPFRLVRAGGAAASRGTERVPLVRTRVVGER